MNVSSDLRRIFDSMAKNEQAGGSLAYDIPRYEYRNMLFKDLSVDL